MSSSNPEVRAALAEAQLSHLKAALEDMRAQRDAWQAQAQQLARTDTRAAADMTEAKETVARLEREVTALRHPKPKLPQSQPWWKRLAG
jgi:predicted nuclease with TOPRIM domain